MSSLTQVLFIGLDSAEPTLVRQWCDDGLLPTLKSLYDRGISGDLHAPAGFGNGAIWPTLFTGCNPGRHGRYFYTQLDPDDYEFKRFNDDHDFGKEPFWAVLSTAGKRVAVFDVMRGPLTKNLNGIQLADWTTHDRNLPMRSWPPELTEEVIARFGDDPHGGNTDKGHRNTEEFVEFRDETVKRVETKTDLSLHYLQQGGWDLFMTNYADPHDIGHHCWHLHDPGHYRYDAQWVQQFGNPVRDVYMATDRAVARLVEAAGPEAMIVVFIGPGMEPHYSANHLMDPILRRLEHGREAKAYLHSISPLKKMYRSIVPRAVRRQINTFTGRNARNAQMVLDDRRMRRCFAVPHNVNAGAIRINLQGREKAGRVRPGSEYNALCDELDRDLRDIVNLDSGEPLVKDVVRLRDTSPGELAENMPDLFVIWNRSAPIFRIASPKIGQLSQPETPGRTGDHTPNTALLIVDPSNRQPSTFPASARVEDVAPTVASLLDITLDDVDGKTLLELSRTS